MKKLLLFAILLPFFGISASHAANIILRGLLSDGLQGNESAIQTIRKIGPAAVEDLKSRFPRESASPRELTLIDRVAAQKDALFSGLYWHTDLELAKAQAAREKKPILSLRLLGNLSEEFSCANSRYFRALLYTDPKIAELLRSNFILHWESVRPVPQITIDFGDGRKLKTTATGNSIHYILSPNGSVLDAIPGLYQPTVFLRELQSSLSRIQLGARIPEPLASPQEAALTPVAFPSAAAAGFLTVSKIALERPVLKVVSPSLPPAIPAAPFHGNRTISESSIQFMKWKLGAAFDAKSFEQQLNNLEMALDRETQTNQNVLRPQILRWISQNPKISLQELNERVYRELFLTPREDPWLGMRSEAAYSGLSNDGIELAR